MNLLVLREYVKEFLRLMRRELKQRAIKGADEFVLPGKSAQDLLDFDQIAAEGDDDDEDNEGAAVYSLYCVTYLSSLFCCCLHSLLFLILFC